MQSDTSEMYFQINVTPKAEKSAGAQEKALDVQAVLVLAPFQPQPHLNIESSINVPAQTSLIIKNISSRSLNVKVSRPPPEERRILLSATELSLSPESSATLWLSWTPLESGSWRDTLQLTDNRRLKFEIPLTTTCLASKKSNVNKSSRHQPQKILVPSNDNNPSKTHLRPSDSLLHRKQQKKLPDNKENITKRQLSSNVSSKGSRLSNASVTSDFFFKPSNGKNYQNFRCNTDNYSQNSQNSYTNRQNVDGLETFNTSNFQLTPLKNSHPPGSEKTSVKYENHPQGFDIHPSNHQETLLPSDTRENFPRKGQIPFNPYSKVSSSNSYTNHQNLEIPGAFNISSFQLTPLKDSNLHKSEKFSTEQDNHHQDFDFSPRDPRIISPDNQQHSLPLRRETYLNPDPKFCKLPPLQPLEHEEDFDDSLSPKPDDRKNSGNFSALIDDLANFTTPQKSNCPRDNRGLTVTRTIKEEIIITNHNGTFEIAGSGGEVRRQLGELEFCFEHDHKKPINHQGQSEVDQFQGSSGVSTSMKITRGNRDDFKGNCHAGDADHSQNHYRSDYRTSETDDYHNLSGISAFSRDLKGTEGFVDGDYGRREAGQHQNHVKNDYRQSADDGIYDSLGVSNCSRTFKDPGDFLRVNYNSRVPAHHQSNYQQSDKFPQNYTGAPGSYHRQSEYPELYVPVTHGQPFNLQRHSSVEDFTAPHQNQHPQSRQPDTDHFLRSVKLSKSFGRLSPVSSNTSSPEESLPPVSSSPFSSIRTTDSSTVQQVIEADLWLKDEPKTPLRHQKSISLESITEETSFSHQLRLPQINFNLNVTKTFSSPLKPTVFEISPVKRSCGLPGGIRGLRETNYHRISPRKPSRIGKDRTKENQMFLKRTKMALGRQKTIPGVRVTKLSLSKLHKPKEPKIQEQSVKLHNPEQITFDVFHLDPFAATMTEDPFLASSLYYDENWMWSQEMEFKKWLNALLTPPEHLSADVDSGRVDVGKVWQSCRTKESIPLAETREAVSARYHTNHRLNTLRKAALVLFNSSEVRSILSRTVLMIEKGNLVVRQDKDLHRDIGLQKEILELFFGYNPLWLRIGLEVVYGETIPLASNNDLIGLTKFILSRFFNDPFLAEKYSHQNSTLKTPNFMPNLNKFILKKFILLVYFLDYAKRNKLIAHDPCLFHKKAQIKESREILLNFSRQTLSGVGDITKMLKPHGYVLMHKQTYLDEYDYAVKDLSVDLRDGVRLCRIMEIIIGGKNLTSKCRVPAISRLQKVHNADVALSALHEAGYVITGDIDAKAVADGHREKTLSLLWQIIYRFQAPRFARAAKILQKWWRANLYYIHVRNYLRRRRSNAAIAIQCCWRSYRARRMFQDLKTQKQNEIFQRNNAAELIQTWWRSLKDRRSFLACKRATIILQTTWRRYRISKPYLRDLQRKKNAASAIQRFFRSYRIMKSQRDNYLETRVAALMIQRWYRTMSQGHKDREAFNNLKATAIFVQRRFRANKSMNLQKNKYLVVLTSVKTIQRWWRGHLLTKRTRNEFIIKKHSVKIISYWYSGLQSMKIERKSFLEKRNSAVVIQRAFRRVRETKDHRQQLKEAMRAVVVIQTWWRRVHSQRQFEAKRKSAIIIQRWYISSKLTIQLNRNYLKLKSAAIIIQKSFRMKIARKEYFRMKRSVTIISHWYLNLKASRAIRNEFSRKRNAVIALQRRFRSLQATRKQRKEFLEMRQSVRKIQILWRSKTLTRKTRTQFLEMKAAVVTVQTFFRGLVARRKLRHLQDCQRAAKILQRAWRAQKLSKQIRENYLNKRSSIICIQRRLRATLAARKSRREYETLRKAVISVQRRFRAQRMMRTMRRSFLAKKRAVVLVQSIVRMRKCLRNYQRVKTAVTVIQAKWRSTVVSRVIRQDYLKLKTASIFLQRTFRAKLEGRRVRREFLQVRTTVVAVQRAWRRKLKAREQREAAVVIQIWWRSMVIARRERKLFQEQKKAAIVVQKFFRGWMETKKRRQEFERVRKATSVIQSCWRRFRGRRERKKMMEARRTAVLVIVRWWRAVVERRRREEEERETLRKQIRAARVIQAAWRGHQVRKEQSTKIKELRIRSKKAAEAAVPSTTVAYRLEEAMNGLMTFNNVGQLSMCLACIDILTRLSIKGCVMFCKLQLVEKIYDLLEQSNRSLPWMDVCMRCTNILITLAKLPDTAREVRRLEYMETVARLMNVTIKGQTELFLNLATLLWVLLGDEEFRMQVINDQRTVWLVKSACSTGLKREGKGTPMKRRNTSLERIIVLPNPKPDWGLANRRPRCFLKVEHALWVLMEMFEIQTFGV
ncbi:protein abnormal spindle [Diachasmimorpha longicaudata]|uniref:protein abnormal spindle n=1 Tax=Diachasmimorpha longicaudata TaxID=58733 RepID=UPI0030B86BFA